MTSSTTATAARNPHHHLPSDCLHLIFHYYIFPFNMTSFIPYNNPLPFRNKQGHWISKRHGHISGCSQDPEWRFLRKYAHCVEIKIAHKEIIRLNEFLLHCRHHYHKPAFHYLEFSQLPITMDSDLLRGVPNICLGCVGFHSRIESRSDGSMDTVQPKLERLFENLRGIQTLDFDVQYLPIPLQSFRNLRGIKKLTLHNYVVEESQSVEEIFQNLRGLSHLELRGCRFSSDVSLLPHLRGVYVLKIHKCYISLPEEDFRYLRGIRKLEIREVGKFILTDQISEQLRGIEELVISMERFHHPVLTNVAFENLRGIRKLFLITHSQNENITDEAFVNLRGIQSLHIGSFPNITVRIFDQLRGIEILRIIECHNIIFSAESLHKLKGIHTLLWFGHQSLNFHTYDKHLNEEILKELHGAKELYLDQIKAICHDALRHLNQVKVLHLYGHEDCRVKNLTLDESAFTHLEHVEQLQLGIMMLDVTCLPIIIKEKMPRLKSICTDRCRILKTALSGRGLPHITAGKDNTMERWTSGSINMKSSCIKNIKDAEIRY